MTYTKEEIEQVKENLRKIRDYTRQNYCTRLRERERISVAFGELERYPGQWEPEHKHSFGFDAEGGIWFRTGGAFVGFADDDNGSDKSIFRWWSYGEDLLVHWVVVKNLVEKELRALEERRRAVINFEV
jgi:hypothetical protein